MQEHKAEQRTPASAIALMAMTALAALAFAAGAGCAVNYKKAKAPNAVEQLTVAEDRTPTTGAEKEVRGYCPIEKSGLVASPIPKWVRYADARDCFTIDIPGDWRVDVQSERLRLFSPRNVGYAKPDMLASGDVWVRAVSYADLSPGTGGNDTYRLRLAAGGADGVRELRPGVLASNWLPVTHGDGSSTPEAAKSFEYYAARALYGVNLSTVESAGIDRALLEKVAATFQAQ